MKEKLLQRWRKSHREPGRTRSMTTETAGIIMGLSSNGYMKQVVGERQLSRQTALLMTAWDLMPDTQREIFLEVAKAFEKAMVSKAVFDFSAGSSVDQESEEEHFYDRFHDLLRIRQHYARERSVAISKNDRTYLDQQIEGTRRELEFAIDMLVASVKGVPKKAATH